MSDTDPLEVFRSEAQELLEQIEEGLLDLEQDPSDGELVAGVFRALHTLKGSGAMFGFEALAAFAHHCETAFDRVRKEQCAATPELIGAVLSAMDHIRALAEGREVSSVEGEDLLKKISAALVAAQDADIHPNVPREWHIAFRLAKNALLNGTHPLGLLDELRALGSCDVRAVVDGIPLLPDLVPAECHLAWDVRLVTGQPRSAIEEVFIFVGDGADLLIEDVSEQPGADSSRKKEPAVVPAEHGAAARSGSLRVPAERLDELMDRVGELVIAQSRLKEISAFIQDANLRSVAEDVERLASGLRDSMMLVRMVPISQLFGRFRRLVHDLSKELGKKIEFAIEGETTELDKTVIERLADPLIHLIRNSVDHGLENAQERIAACKSETGLITLSARQAGTEVIITVGDDGRGIDLEKVRAKAESSGLVAPGAELGEPELLSLLFEPGFSTARSITSLSGRGVGMDVVKRTIEGLRGTTEIKSTKGKGTQISLRIPLTLAIIDGLLVRVGEERFVIPLSSVEECVELTRELDRRSADRNFLDLRESLVPFLRLRDLFATNSEPDPYQKIVVISSGLERVGLVVDQILGQHQTVIKPLSPLHADVKTFSGATILGDGSVALIIDVSHLVELGKWEEERLRAV